MKLKPAMLSEVITHLFKKPATSRYPFEKARVTARFRGRIDFDSAKCIGCQMCVRDCPSNAIAIKKVGDKKFVAEFDLAKCIYCAQCVDSCSRKALESSKIFELASLDREKLKVKFGADITDTKEDIKK